MSTAVRLGELVLANQVMAAAGCLAEEVLRARPGSLPPLGAWVTSSLAARSSRGVPPRLAEAPAGVLYTPGTTRTGIAGTLRRRAAVWASLPEPVIVSLTGDSPEALAAAAAVLEGERAVAAVELDLVTGDEQTDESLGWAPEAVGEAVRLVRRARPGPVLAKLPADAPDLGAGLRAAAAAKADAAVVGGGFLAATRRLVGPATFPLLLAIVSRIAPVAPLPIVAGGGIGSAAHVRAYLRAGAAAVQVGSALLADPLAGNRIAALLGGHPIGTDADLGPQRHLE